MPAALRTGRDCKRNGLFEQWQGIFDDFIFELEPAKVNQIVRIPRLGLHRRLGKYNRLAILVLSDQRKRQSMVDVTLRRILLLKSARRSLASASRPRFARRRP